MPQSAFDAETIFGLQDAGGESHIFEAGRSGWILFNEAVGRDPNDRSGKDYSAFSDRGLTVIVRLNHGHYPQGTIPLSSEYGNFARRCANFVAASRGCQTWIIGNEMNYAIERPGLLNLVEAPPADDPYFRSLRQRHNAIEPALATLEHPETARYSEAGEMITPDRYARCYQLCRNAIHLIPEHTQDRVLVGAVCPWNTHTAYPGNLQGDWIKYFKDILMLIGKECDGITLHAYSHGADPAFVLDDSTLSTYPDRAYHFQVYRDFMDAIPLNLRYLPVFITEAGQDQPWHDSTTGWIQEAYAEIHRWNLEPDHQKIRAMILYRWSFADRWHIDGKPGVIRDFVEALRYPYRWNSATRAPGSGTSDAAPAAPAEEALGSGPRYRVQWTSAHPPQSLPAGQTISFPVTLRNIGTQGWPHSGPNAVELSYRFYQNQQEVRTSAQPIRTRLPHDVAPNQHVTVQTQVQLPEEAGNYTLVLDLLEGGHTWFQDQQSDTLIRWMTVQPDRAAKRAAPPAASTATKSSRQQRPATLAELPTDFAASASTPPVHYTVAEPTITDVSAALPRGADPYLRRALDRIGYIVLSHTGAPPVVTLPAIAHAHISAGYPGIAYHYVVSQSGDILQVCRLDEIASSAEWAAAGINIGLEGTFDRETPKRQQLDAVAELCAWLIGQMPALAVEQVIGLCELIPTTSPGVTFLEGPTWRRLLREFIWARLGVARPAAGSAAAPAVAPSAAGKTPAPARNVSMPDIQDIVAQLPRDPLMFFSRRPEDIQTVVINQTGVAASTPVDVIAGGFRERGLPGILYQYFITEDGAIYQTQPNLQVVDGERPYIANAINIAFAGEFDYTIPTQAQMQAGGALIAWLLAEYPHLSMSGIKGVSELIPHRSPGEQWLQGRRWKELLLQEVQMAPERQPAPRATSSASGQSDGRMHQLEQESGVLQQQTAGLRAENERLRREVEALRAEPKRVHRIEAPPIVDIVNQLPHHPTLRYDERRQNLITHLAVHHTAVPPHVGPERIAELHVSEDPSRGKRPWPGIGYHFFVRADGRLLRTQPIERVAYHTAGHNEYTVGVVFAGSFMNGVIPSAEQLSSGAYLLTWLMQELNVPLQHVWGHREFPDNRTACPGSEWLEGRKWRDLLYAEIVRVQRGE